MSDGSPICDECALHTDAPIYVCLSCHVKLTEAADCGQDGVCKRPPGCQRHWEERARELVRERDELRAEVERLRGLLHAELIAEMRYCETCELGYMRGEGSSRGCPYCEVERLTKALESVIEMHDHFVRLGYEAVPMHEMGIECDAIAAALAAGKDGGG